MKCKLLALVLAFGLALPAPALAAIVDRPIVWNARRKALTEQYARTHYGSAFTSITPRAVVVHWTADDKMMSAWNWFNREASPRGTAQVASHFIVDRDGTIYRLTPETRLDPHAIGYNWCAIGIENVGGKGGREDLTETQLHANAWLIRYLHKKYPTIHTVFGHYQQDQARSTGLYKELIQGYHSVKHDPGPKFMKGLQELLQDDGLQFFKP